MKKIISIAIIDCALLIAACLGAYFIKYFPEVSLQVMYVFMMLLVCIQAVSLACFDLFRWSFHHASLSEFFRLMRALFVGGCVFVCVTGLLGAWHVWQFVAVEWLLASGFLGVFRYWRRLHSVLLTKSEKGMKRVLVVGAGEAGESIVRKMKQAKSFGFYPVAFVDDDMRKRGMRIRGLLVVGGIECIPSTVKKYEIDEIVITIPSAEGPSIRRVISFCEKTAATVKILPGIWDIILGDAYLHQIRDVKPEDLLGRESVTIDLNAVKDVFRDTVVLVTGACGSIGSELVRQLSTFPVKAIIAVDRNENAMYFFQTAYAAQNVVVPILADVSDPERMKHIFIQQKPDIVFHAAAYKHVPLMEQFPVEAVRNNIQVTRLLIDLSCSHAVSHFILISTDKAVEPSNVMGCTKRIAEMLVQAHKKSGATQCSAVRFGNVLGSNGSIVPILKEQIEHGGPVTITHKDMKRYFMTIPEAVQLILQATEYSAGGDIFVLDMGEQVRIDDFAREMIRLMGFQPDKDISVEYIGLRPGEKLEEKLFSAEEGCRATVHEKIRVVGQVSLPEYKKMCAHVDALLRDVEKCPPAERAQFVIARLKALVSCGSDTERRSS